tara:strand:+ start:1406 stop:1636 length:231 start_codon:yes stop_codon:yes gene_type:complete
MKAQLILLLLLVVTVTSKTYATEAERDPKQPEVKKTTKSKYDFNIFKLYSFVHQQEKSDSLNNELKALPPKREEAN